MEKLEANHRQFLLKETIISMFICAGLNLLSHFSYLNLRMRSCFGGKVVCFLILFQQFFL